MNYNIFLRAIAISLVRRVQFFAPNLTNGYLHIIITSYDRKPIFIENIDILRTAFKKQKQSMNLK